MESNCPYRGLPEYAVWRQSVGSRNATAVFPIEPSPLTLAPGTRVASAGSCFAQRIADHLPEFDLDYLVTEPGPSFLDELDRRRFGYGVYSARYGNVYTTLQLAQLVERAYGHFDPQEPLWTRPDGRVVDPFRPGINAHGFRSATECLADRDQHLTAVRQLIETAEVFVFTLGLTEAWVSRADGSAFPVCPGCGHGGTFDADRYRFVNFGVTEVVEHLDRFVRLARHHNPQLQIVLTVSPVPLLATFSERHVLNANTWSKSVLRVACDEIRRRHDRVDYFAAYEAVLAGGPEWAFESDRRSVTPEAVAHVMECFRRQFGLARRDSEAVQATTSEPVHVVAMPDSTPRRHPAPMCDEDQILAAMARERTR